MYKALIIDDERPTRQAITSLGKWTELGIEPPLQAPEGLTGLEMMRSQIPDIVLVDMKMPVMNGLEFIKAAATEFPNSKYVIISGYSDFEFARTAIKYNVCDYLLKPVIEEELDNVLKQVVQRLDNERLSLRYNPISHIARALASEPYTLVKGNTYYGIVVVYLVNKFDEERSEEFDFSKLGAELASIIGQCWDKDSGCSSLAENSRQLLLTVKIPTELFELKDRVLKMREYVANQTSKVIEVIRTLYGIYTIGAVGSFGDKIESVYESYEDALELLNNVNLLDDGQGVYTTVNSNPSPKWLSVIGKKELFTRAFEQKNLNNAKELIEKYFDSLKKYGYMSLDDLKRVTVEFITIFREIALEKGVVNLKKLIPQIGDNSIYTNMYTTEDFSAFILKVFQGLVESTLSPDAYSISNIIVEIKEYIDNNFSEEISLTIFSSKHHMTKEYLSKQFKEQFNYGIYEYVLKLRMTKAAEYLADFNIKIQDIAQRVGYVDNNYFSRAFKTFHGVSPKEYRTRNS